MVTTTTDELKGKWQLDPIKQVPRKQQGLTFIEPARAHRLAFENWLTEWKDDPYDPYRWIFERAWRDFDWYVDLCDRMRTEGCPPLLSVPLDVRWAFVRDELVGELYLFYEPMDAENHIGYKVRPSFRRLGVGTALLRYGLERLKERGIKVARLTCADTNVGSIALLTRAGGKRLEDRCGREGQLIRRYSVPTG